MIGQMAIRQMFQALHQRFGAHVSKSEWTARKIPTIVGFPIGGFAAAVGAPIGRRSNKYEVASISKRDHLKQKHPYENARIRSGSVVLVRKHLKTGV
jgi:hypothetical protein